MQRRHVLTILPAGLCLCVFLSCPAKEKPYTKVTYNPSVAFPASGVFDFVFETPAMPHDPGVDKVGLESRMRRGVIETLEEKGTMFRGNVVRKGLRYCFMSQTIAKIQ